MSIRKGSTIIAGNLGQNIDDNISLLSSNPVKNSAIAQRFEETIGINNITSCITKIPQDIKLELSGTTLTLKAGSKFYYPNGTNNGELVFDSFTTSTDFPLNVGVGGSVDDPRFIILSNTGTISLGCTKEVIYSGSNTPSTVSSQDCLWYDNANNIIRRTTDGGTTWGSTPYSFPICMVRLKDTVSGACDKILQVFNGYGYIAKCTFVLPGLEGLISDGRNSDGTLKNIELTFDSVKVRNLELESSRLGLLAQDGLRGWGVYNYIESETKPDVPATEQYFRWYDTSNNLSWVTTDYGSTWQRDYSIPINLFTKWGAQDNILKISQRESFRALDYNDTVYMAHQAMPSDTYWDMELGATGTEYIAPRDGYVFIRTVANNGACGITIHGTQTPGAGSYIYIPSGDDGRLMVPFRNNTRFKVWYSNIGTGTGANATVFRFIFATGAK